ncbi:NAD(P)-dependent dehydrogenase (short-subunit alcohol dehydrogenase family) [Filimonas zeae]|uniref:Short-chain dehydrogenase/reductase n=1 Tax=Filimonas zeae TaxID=1737353 RepID=A0A917MSC7_9BACT|nr:SDR family oxidoreductase [Filimonas zeae]MDR6338009.1 NAD(P)-dependent dehydrogenase (short-subunit alcohol dehydrogenase family) [Filimonas zeae]GGH61278.1 short-chain dehydrogenase/reductase [Filimonas zeae]
MQKTIFITGTSSGLGKAAARLFQSKGWKVIATMRNPEKETELNQLENVTLLALDVTNNQQVEQTVADTLRLHAVDVVLNNAGYGLIGPLEALTGEQIATQIQTNLSGVIQLSKAFIPYFREKRSGVFINVTSTFGLLSFPTCSIYSATKFGVDGFSEGLFYELAQFGVQVKVVAPGGMQTDFTGRSLQGGIHPAYQQLIDKVSEGYSPEQVANYTKPEEVAQIIFEAATDGKGQLRYVAGKDATALYNERLEAGPEAQAQKIKAQFML